MRYSVYLQLATLLIRADLRREERAWKRRIRRSAYMIPWHSQHLLKDIGLAQDGRPMGQTWPVDQRATRHVRHLRHILNRRIPT